MVNKSEEVAPDPQPSAADTVKPGVSGRRTRDPVDVVVDVLLLIHKPGDSEAVPSIGKILLKL